MSNVKVFVTRDGQQDEQVSSYRSICYSNGSKMGLFVEPLNQTRQMNTMPQRHNFRQWQETFTSMCKYAIALLLLLLNMDTAVDISLYTSTADSCIQKGTYVYIQKHTYTHVFLFTHIHTHITNSSMTFAGKREKGLFKEQSPHSHTTSLTARFVHQTTRTSSKHIH